MGKATWAAPLYLSVVWTLMISYQLFTQTAVTTVVARITQLQPSVGGWLASRIDMIVFIYAFAWVFVLATVIPTVILGRERSVLVQFFVTLTLTFLAFIIQDGIVTLFEGETIEQIFNLEALLHNTYLATAYLLLPFLLMLILDLRSKQSKQYVKL